jgi:hypothetical protein
MQARRQSEVQRRKMEAMGSNSVNFQLGSRQITIDEPGRRLDRSAQKGFGRD